MVICDLCGSKIEDRAIVLPWASRDDLRDLCFDCSEQIGDISKEASEASRAAFDKAMTEGLAELRERYPAGASRSELNDWGTES
jgi:hypothetical protein